MFCWRARPSRHRRSSKLEAMEQQPNDSPSPSSQSFAGLLASLTSPAGEAAKRNATWNDGALGDDVVTLSYEQALRNHARYKPDSQVESACRADEVAPLRGSPRAPASGMGEGGNAAARSGAERAAGTARKPRTASVTIRMSQAECARLRQRAAEAGLTVSSYLRSCALEADTLRTQVKQALAELKTAAEVEFATAPSRRFWFGWIGRNRRRKQ